MHGLNFSKPKALGSPQKMPSYSIQSLLRLCFRISIQESDTCFIQEVRDQPWKCTSGVGKEFDYSTIVEKLLPVSTTGMLWDNQGASPYLTYYVSFLTFYLFIFNVLCIFKKPLARRP